MKEPSELTGTSIIDQFAMAALTGILANPETETDKMPTPISKGVIAARAYEYAHAMMEQRLKRTKTNRYKRT